MKFSNKRLTKQPSLVIIPMIDIMFFLLVFFMLSTMYMVTLHTIPVQLPTVQNATVANKTVILNVTLQRDGSVWLNQEKMTQEALFQTLQQKMSHHINFSLLISADKNINYGQVVKFMDTLHSVGINNFALSVEKT